MHGRWQSGRVTDREGGRQGGWQAVRRPGYGGGRHRG